MNDVQLSQKLFGRTSRSDDEIKTDVVVGTAKSDSKDGYVTVDIGGATLSADDSQFVQIATTADIREGDQVEIALTGKSNTPRGALVTGAYGGGDRTRAEIDAMVSFVDVEYALSASSNTPPSGGWQTDAPETTESMPYVWTRTFSVTRGGDVSYTTPIVISGGKQGDAGRGISSITEEYYMSGSRTELTGGAWSSVVTSPSDEQYVWTRSVVTYTDGATSTTDPVSVSGVKGDQGEQGPKGETGPQGPKGDTGATGAAGADGRMLVAKSSTAAGTAAKVASLVQGTLKLTAGASVSVMFTNANTAASPTLNVANTGAKPIRTNGTPYAYWVAGASVTFVYDETYWQVCSVPVYASTVTIGNPGAIHQYLDSDSMDILNGSGAQLASYSANKAEIGKNSKTAAIEFAAGSVVFGRANASGGGTYTNLNASDGISVTAPSDKQLIINPMVKEGDHYISADAYAGFLGGGSFPYSINTGSLDLKVHNNVTLDEIPLGEYLINWENDWSGTTNSGSSYTETSGNITLTKGMYIVFSGVRIAASSNGERAYRLIFTANSSSPKKDFHVLVGAFHANNSGTQSMTSCHPFYVDKEFIGTYTLYSDDWNTQPTINVDDAWGFHKSDGTAISQFVRLIKIL